MSLRRITAEDALQRLDGYSAIIDARSESEHAEDHLPGALNWPSLTDTERRDIGTLYKQVSPFEARKRGAALVALNIGHHLQRHVLTLPRDWRPLVYCWRGGQRSGALALVLDQIGFGVTVLEGGYVAFRRAVRSELDTLPAALSLRVLCGRTGTGKSRLLQALREAGAQVLDLEALACHRGSVLGPLPSQAQPSQKAFDTAIWCALRALDPARVVFVEGESRTIGRLRLPDMLLDRLRGAPCVRVDLPVAERVQLLLQDYAHFVQDVDSFCRRLDALRELRGADTIGRWQACARQGQLACVVQELLELHYDPVYEKSMVRNFSGFASASPLSLQAADPQTLAAAAQLLHGSAIP